MCTERSARNLVTGHYRGEGRSEAERVAGVSPGDTYGRCDRRARSIRAESRQDIPRMTILPGFEAIPRLDRPLRSPGENPAKRSGSVGGSCITCTYRRRCGQIKPSLGRPLAQPCMARTFGVRATLAGSSIADACTTCTYLGWRGVPSPRGGLGRLALAGRRLGSGFLFCLVGLGLRGPGLRRGLGSRRSL
jgi:hypothetical protein